MNRHNAEMTRRSPRLLSKGYYLPQDPRSQLVSYKEPLGRAFNTRKKKPKLDRVRRNLFTEISRSDIENMEKREVMLPSDTLHQEDDTLPDPPPDEPPVPPSLSSSSSVVRKMPPVLLFLLLALGVCFSYMCVSKFLAHNPDTLNHGALFREIELLKQGVEEFRFKYKDYANVFHRALNLHRADDVGMADYALESLGATVKSSSETLKTKYCSLFGIGYWCQNNGPETVLQPVIHPGKCWPFKGSKGNLVIEMPCPIRITHVTLQHLPRVLSPTNQINSAPKDFSVYGLNHTQNESKILGVFTYDQDGEPIQTFKLTGCPSEAFQQVQLRILSNWGHEYTCVYRFRLHSQPSCT